MAARFIWNVYYGNLTALECQGTGICRYSNALADLFRKFSDFCPHMDRILFSFMGFWGPFGKI